MTTNADYHTEAGLRRFNQRRENMFGLKKNRELYEVMADVGEAMHSRYADSVIPSHPEPITVTFDELEDLSEYQEVADVLGFRPPQIAEQSREKTRRALIGFMLDEGFPIYSNTEVAKFMTDLAEKADKVFCWARLDKPSLSEIREQSMRDTSRRIALISVRGTVPTKDHGQFVNWQYKRPVPLDILKRAVAVKKQFPTAEIFVSDYAVVNPDPFIAARVDDCEHVVFGVWDEPGFKAIGRDAEK